MASKDYSFIAYIDESGDDGFKEHSSDWFVLSAYIVRSSRDNEIVSLKKQILKDIDMEKTKNIHMLKMKNHEKKCYIAKKIGEFPSRSISVLSNKHNLSSESFTNMPNMYYWYLSRLLIERITWCCSSLRKTVPEGNGKVKIIFSNRGGLKYQDFITYLEEWKKRDSENTKQHSLSRINWNMIDIDIIESVDHSKRAGLQFADVVAYSNFKAVEKSRISGVVSLDLVRVLRDSTYNKDGIYINRGIKFMPKYEEIKDKPEDLYDLFTKK